MSVFCLQPEAFYFIQASNAGHQRHRGQCVQRRDGVCDHSARWWENIADMWSTVHLFDVIKININGPIKPHWILQCVRSGWVLTVHCFLFLSFPVPDEPPVILLVKPITTTSVMVQWKVMYLDTQGKRVQFNKLLSLYLSLCFFYGFECNYHYFLDQERSA